MNVGGDDHAAECHLVTNQLGCHIFASRDVPYLLGNNPGPRIMHLRADGVTETRLNPLVAIHVSIIGVEPHPSR